LNVLITRPLNQADSLYSLIQDSGHNSLLFPTLRIDKLMVDIDANNYDAIIFISANAVEHALEQIKFTQERSQNIFAVGRATADKLREYGISVDCYPENNASSEALLSMSMVSKMKNSNILIIRGRGGREALKLGLSIQNNNVDYAEVYERVECEALDLHRESLSILLNNHDGVLTITSTESLSAMINIAQKIDSDCLEIIKSMPLVVLSNRIRDFAKSVGFIHLYVAYETNNQGLVAVINQLK